MAGVTVPIRTCLRCYRDYPASYTEVCECQGGPKYVPDYSAFERLGAEMARRRDEYFLQLLLSGDVR